MLKSIKWPIQSILCLLGLMLVSSLGEGISLLLLIPLLHYTGITPQSVEPQHTDWLHQLLPHHMSLLSVLAIYASLVIGFACINYAKSMYSSHFQQRIIQQCRSELFKATCYAPWSLLSRQTMPHILQMLTTEIQRISGALQQGIQLVTQVIMIGIYLTLAFYLSWQLTVFAVIACGAMLLVTKRYSIYAKRNGKHAFGFFRELHKIIEQTLQGIKQAKLWQAEQQYVQSLDQLNQTLNRNQVDFMRSQANSQWLFTTGGVVIISCMLYLSLNVFHSALSHVLVLIVTFARLLPKVASAQRCAQLVINNLGGAKTLWQFYQQCQQRTSLTSDDRGPLKLQRGIELLDMSFSYDGNNASVLNKINATIPAHKITAVNGPSGIGKSTLLDCISGLITPDSGCIRIDGSSLNANNQARWLKQIAYVNQDPFLLHDSIRNNMLWVKPNASDDDIWQALAFSEAATFVKRLPKQLDSTVGHRGLHLSGGERQRLVLAQAILRQPRCLILDEATSQLDQALEQRILQRLRGLCDRTTIILVSHRPDTLHIADHSIELKPSNDCADTADTLQSHAVLT